MVGCCLLFGVFALKKILSRGIGNKEKSYFLHVYAYSLLLFLSFLDMD